MAEKLAEGMAKAGIEAMRDGTLLSPQDTRFRQDGAICDADLSSRFERLGEVAGQFAR